MERRTERIERRACNKDGGGERAGGRARAGGMVGEVPLAPRVEDKEEAREKSRGPSFVEEQLTQGSLLVHGPGRHMGLV